MKININNFIVFHSVLLRMKNVLSDIHGRANQTIRFMFTNFFFENRSVYAIMWKNIVQGGGQDTDVNMAHAYCMLGNQWRIQEFFSGGGGFPPGIFLGGSANSVDDRGQRGRRSGGCSPLVRGSTQFANE
jgi:hypothetical protein